MEVPSGHIQNTQLYNQLCYTYKIYYNRMLTVDNIINRMQHSPPWEANTSSAIQEFPRVLWNR